LALCIPAAVIFAKEQEKLRGNLHYQRKRLATRILKKYLRQATEYAQNKDRAFYTAAQTGLLTYLADVLHIARGSTADAVLLELKSRIDSATLYQRTSSMIERCNQARFMPGGFASENIPRDFELLKEIMADIAKLKL